MTAYFDAKLQHSGSHKHLYRSYALQNPGVRVIWDLGNDVFKTQLEGLQAVLSRITAGLLSAVEAHR